MVVMAENQLITSFSVDVDQKRIFMSIRKAGPGRSSLEVQVKNDCWGDDPGESRAELRMTYWKADPGRSSSDAHVRKVCLSDDPRRSTLEVQVRKVCAWHFKIRRASKGGYLER